MPLKESNATIEQTLVFPITFVDVLSQALAQAGKTEFTSDWEKWHSTIRSFIEEKGTTDDLLQEVHFQIRNPYTPFSEQVEAFLSIMRRSGCFSVVSQGGQSRYMIDQETKAHLIAAKDERLEDKQEYITELAQKISDNLGIK